MFCICQREFRETKEWFDFFQAAILQPLQSIELFLPASCHFCFSASDIFADKFLGLLNLLLLSRILTDVILSYKRFLSEKLGIGPIVFDETLMVDIADSICNFVQKIIVVRYNKKGSFQIG